MGTKRKRKPVFQALQVIVEQDEAGLYVAECPALRACYTQGETYEEVIENIKDVISMCLEDQSPRTAPQDPPRHRD